MCVDTISEHTLPLSCIGNLFWGFILSVPHTCIHTNRIILLSMDLEYYMLFNMYSVSEAREGD